MILHYVRFHHGKIRRAMETNGCATRGNLHREWAVSKSVVNEFKIRQAMEINGCAARENLHRLWAVSKWIVN